VFPRVELFILHVWVVELIFGVEWYHLLLVRLGFRFVCVMLVSRRLFILRFGLRVELVLFSSFENVSLLSLRVFLLASEKCLRKTRGWLLFAGGRATSGARSLSCVVVVG
jgi:hypothetical protein